MKEKQILAVIDTNVIVSALLNHDSESNSDIRELESLLAELRSSQK